MPVPNSLPIEFLTVMNLTRDLAAIYREHDALLYTDDSEEAFATVPPEAMACGLPVIGAYIGGARELLRHAKTLLPIHPGMRSSSPRAFRNCGGNRPCGVKWPRPPRPRLKANTTSLRLWIRLRVT